MKTIYKTTLLLFVMLMSNQILSAQTVPAEGTIGLRSTIGSQASIEVPYQLNESLSLAGTLLFNGTEDTQTTIGIGVRPRYYMGSTSAISTYFTGILGFQHTSFNAGGSATFFSLGVGYGAEYFFSEQFSLSGDANLTSNLGGDIANSISTGARISASFYFN